MHEVELVAQPRKYGISVRSKCGLGKEKKARRYIVDRIRAKEVVAILRAYNPIAHKSIVDATTDIATAII